MKKETTSRTMNKELSKRISKSAVGQAQRFRNLTLFPLLAKDIKEPEYIVMIDAIVDKRCVTITEVSSGGSVPNIMVTNESDKKILILDGEELIGAKQNRVANTTILLDANSKTVIPVSCTEQGRWRSMSHKFSHSKTVMAPKVRKKKLMSVSHSLKSSPEPCYASDQGEVWSEIAQLHSKVGTHSPTGAMHDAHESRRDDLSEYKRHFKPVDKQFGVLAFIDGKPAGADMLSLGKAFKRNFGILIESYAMEALSSSDPDRETLPEREPAEKFLEGLPGLEESDFKSVGLGRDCRYEGPEAVGAALMVDDTPVHAAFFTREGSSDRRRQRSNERQTGRIDPFLYESVQGDGSSSNPPLRDYFASDYMNRFRERLLRDLEREMQQPGKTVREQIRLRATYRSMLENHRNSRTENSQDNSRSETS
jgi:hypothetical protein